MDADLWCDKFEMHDGGEALSMKKGIVFFRGFLAAVGLLECVRVFAMLKKRMNALSRSPMPLPFENEAQRRITEPMTRCVQSCPTRAFQAGPSRMIGNSGGHLPLNWAPPSF